MYEEKKFSEIFKYAPTHIFTAPGRTELGGNHTDHQHGCVLAAAVDLGMTAAAAENGLSVIRVQSEGWPLCEIHLDRLTADPSRFGTTEALITGVAAAFPGLRGFDAYMTSDVPPGSGLSSSAAFEVLIGAICSACSDAGTTDPIELAKIGQRAENLFFGKPCGLMDQMACACGGVVGIDFADEKAPVVTRIAPDLASFGYALCIIDSGADHSGMTADYASIPEELAEVCALFGKPVLRDIEEARFMDRVSEVRSACGDRAVLRALHFYEENRRAQQELQALQTGDFETFLTLVRQSGNSSWMYLQNVIPCGSTLHQELAFSIALAQRLLGGKGAVRVHGGGFAGTLQAFVPVEALEGFREGMERVLGAGTCHVVSFRKEGAVLKEVICHK